MHTPSIGRIVHVLVDPAHNNSSDTAPAMITRVWSDTCVNLRVIGDCSPGTGPEWLTSHQLFQTREEIEEKHRLYREEHPTEGHHRPQGAFWPPHV
jgi:hypothetical protein